jgi:hypothetical protein
MPEVDATPETAQPESQQAPGSADIVLGVLSYNDAGTIQQVIQAAKEGANSFFPDSRTVIASADGGSKDGTPQLAQEAAAGAGFLQVTYPVSPVDRLSPEYWGIPGRRNAVRAILAAAIQMGARACAIVDSDVRTIAPDWIKKLVAPVLQEGFDFVSPCYVRHKYEGMLLSGIIYPLVRALYGKRIRQPLGAEFALSTKMMDAYLGEPSWTGNGSVNTIDDWLAIRAASGNFRMAQTVLGPRLQNQRNPAPDLSTVLAQVLGSLYAEVNRTAPVWQRVRGSESVPAFGSDSGLPPEPPSVDIQPMIESFRLGYQNLLEIWRVVLPPATLLELKKLAARTPETFRLEDAVWARIVYDFALAYRMRVIDRDHLLRALTPLYLGWVASYVLQTQDAGQKDAEQRIESLCLAYEGQKGYLISRWRWPDRFTS